MMGVLSNHVDNDDIAYDNEDNYDANYIILLTRFAYIGRPHHHNFVFLVIHRAVAVRTQSLTASIWTAPHDVTSDFPSSGQ